MVVINGVVGNNTHRKLSDDEFRGFVLSDTYAPLIFVNGVDAKAAQMFTLAHELAHLWLGQAGVFNLEALQPANNAVERFCDKVAAEFLIPTHEFKAAWSEAERAEEPYQFLARQFKVSPLVAARRALDLGLIGKGKFLTFYRAYREDERRKKSKSDGGNFYATQGVRIGKRFGDAVVRAVKEGRMLYGDAYALTGLRGRSFDKYAESLGYQM
jgi:Zn-dependent peptidase ImmA (M78 family)